ncbi:hypothetical protein QQP08_015796 [Theobroma cacao]|nr:hypothetical protein QQP08_015796 [Theobroma cacao]
MECNKLPFLFAAMAVVLLATVTPTAFAARNEVVPFSANANAKISIRNPFANIFMVGISAEKCLGLGESCSTLTASCCSGCVCFPAAAGLCIGTCA